MTEQTHHALLEIVDGDHVRGAMGARTTILIYGDYECPHTRAVELTLKRLRRLGTTDGFRSVYRSFPLREIHPHAQMAAEAAEAVYGLGGADSFWVIHDGLFAHQDELDAPGLERRAAEAKVDPVAFRALLTSGGSAARIERDVQSGTANGVNSTPAIFINGVRYFGGRDVEGLQQVLMETNEG